MRLCIAPRPYDYCGRTCGALAAATGNQTAGPAVICKVGRYCDLSAGNNILRTTSRTAIKGPCIRITSSVESIVLTPGRPPMAR